MRPKPPFPAVAATATRNARRSRSWLIASVAPPIPAGDHRAERGGIGGEDQNHVRHGEADEHPDHPKMPVARRLISAEKRGEPFELDRLPEGDPGEHRKRAEEQDSGVGVLLERVVLAMRRVLLAQVEIIL